jgi:hypothetical protein
MSTNSRVFDITSLFMEEMLVSRGAYPTAVLFVPLLEDCFPVIRFHYASPTRAGLLTLF